mmetsp:Transcript_23267/g.51067  ORF Transcript_23267/g.51067 Transcript_23267/m.51067 type:complete len:490 (-) Transcript_23267:182-1651(-)
MGWEDDVGMDGWAAEQVFGHSALGFAFDDITLLPGTWCEEASSADLACSLTNNITLKTPLAAAPAGRLTEWELALGMALVGSVGFIHCHQSILDQAEMVSRAKRFMNGFILEPLTLGPENTVRDLDQLKATKGVGGVPITADGKLGSKLLGWVGTRDTDSVPEKERGKKLKDIMETKVVTGTEPLSLQEAITILREKKVGKLPVVDADGNLVSLVARSDAKKMLQHPNLNLNASNQLVVGASIDVGEDALKRAKALIVVGVDVLFIDGSGEGGDRQLELVATLKKTYPATDIIAGPVSSCREAKRLAEVGVDAVVIGLAVPHLETNVGGLEPSVGRPQASAIYEVASYVRLNYSIPAIAGPGVQSLGQAMKALALGTSAILLASPLVGTDEASSNSKQDASSRSGLAQSVASQGSVKGLIGYWMRGLLAGMQDLGVPNITALHKALDDGDLRLECRAPFSSARAAALAAVRCCTMPLRPEVMPSLAALH